MPRDQRFHNDPLLLLVSKDRMEANSTGEETLQGTVRSLRKKRGRKNGKSRPGTERGPPKFQAGGGDKQ